MHDHYFARALQILIHSLLLKFNMKVRPSILNGFGERKKNLHVYNHNKMNKKQKKTKLMTVQWHNLSATIKMMFIQNI